MSRSAFGYQNVLKVETLSANAAATNLPVTNMQGDTGDSASSFIVVASAVDITLTCSQLYTFNIISFFRSNLSAVSTGTITFYNGSNVVGSFGPVNLNPMNGQVNLIVPASVVNVANKVVVHLTDSALPDGFIRVGMGYWGPLFIPSRQPDFTTVQGWSAVNNVTKTQSGIAYPQFQYIVRTVTLSWSNILNAEFPIYDAINKQAGLMGNILFLFDIDASQTLINTNTVFGMLTPSDSGWQSNVRRTAKQTIEERL